MGLVIRVQVVAGQRGLSAHAHSFADKSSMPPPPQVLALGGAAAAAGVGYALLRARERAASEAAKADEARMNEELQRNRERFEEAKQVREEAMEKLHRGGRRNQRRAAPQDFRELATDRYDDKFAAELWRLGDTLRKAQVASLASQPLFAALPLVGRPEDPRWVELFVLLIWTGGTPKSRAFAQNHGELLLEHLTQGLGGGASCVTAFSHPHIVQWLRELCELQHTDERNETVSVPAFLELTLWRACYSAQFGEPVMWDLPQGFNHKHAESLEPWLREDLGLYLRDASGKVYASERDEAGRKVLVGHWTGGAIAFLPPSVAEPEAAKTAQPPPSKPHPPPQPLAFAADEDVDIEDVELSKVGEAHYTALE